MSSEQHPDDLLGLDSTANRLTALRVVLIPVIVLLMGTDIAWRNITAAVIFGIAGITDYFDGYYARQEKSVSVMGQLMDPLADKFLVASCLIMLQDLGRLHPWVVIVLLCREFAITGLRAVASAEGIIIPASRLAKWKTTTQMAGIPMMILKDSLFGIPFLLPGQILIYTSLLISVWSLKDYVVDFFRTLADQRRRRIEARKAKKESRRMAKKATRIRLFLQKNPHLTEDVRAALTGENPGGKDPQE